MNKQQEIWNVPGKRSVNLIIILLTAAAFLIFSVAEKVTGSNLTEASDSSLLLRCGALYAPFVIRDGEWYRLFTYLFLHGDFSHIVNNMLLLYFIGNAVERIGGKIRYLLIYFVSGILAGLTSIMYNGYQLTKSFNIAKMAEVPIGWPVCIGASGAIFGIVGALAVTVIAGKGKVYGLSLRQMLLFVGLSLYAGFIGTGVDNAAHIGGLAAGMILALLLRIDKGKRRTRTEEETQCG